MPKAKKKKESWVARLKKKVRKHFDEKKKEEEAFKATLKKVKDKKVAAKSKPKSKPKKKAPYPGLKGRTQRGLKQAGVKFKTDQEKAKEKKKKKNNLHKKSGGY